MQTSAAILRIREKRPDGHQSTNTDMTELLQRPHERKHIIRRNAIFCLFAGGIDFNQRGNHASHPFGAGIKLSGEGVAVEGMYQMDPTRNLPDFVRLKVPRRKCQRMIYPLPILRVLPASPERSFPRYRRFRPGQLPQ